MNVNLTQKASDLVVFEIAHGDNKALISLATNMNDLLITVTNFNGNIIKEKTFTDYEVKSVQQFGYKIVISSVDSKNKDILLDISEYNYQVSTNDLVADVKIDIKHDKKEETATMELHENFEPQTVQMGTRIAVIDTQVFTTVVIGTNSLLLYQIFGKHDGQTLDLTDDLKDYVDAFIKDNPLSKTEIKGIKEMQKVIKETLKNCDRVQVKLEQEL